MIRKAEENDVACVAAIYEHILDRPDCFDVIGWIRGIYPTYATAQAASDRGDLYVFEENGAVIAAAIINKLQVDNYADCPWQFDAPDDRVLVLHTLVVDPAASHKGVGSSFVAYYEAMAKNLGCTVLRMDTNVKNSPARSLYKKLGYREAGIVPCEFNGIPDVLLVCLEKKV